MFTVIGSTGYVGKHLVKYLHDQGVHCFTPSRNDPSLFSRKLGHVIYCAGYTADFRSKMLETVEAHVCHLRQIIACAKFDSLLYLSSTRVYQRATCTNEDAFLSVNPQDPGDIYNLSKLMGESLCLSIPRPNMRIVRLSNVYGPEMGPENFLGSLIYDAIEKKEILLKTSLASSKDYISIQDIPPMLVAIAKSGKEKIYNLASGHNTSNKQIVNVLNDMTGCKLTLDSTPKEWHFPRIQIERIEREFDFKPASIDSSLRALI
ncbi:MAG: hypothetical protein S4CHLAM123_04290 [Chlamydiales bacterium]|nr:hypothetical protein [Chlamydiales bacterium]